MLQDTAGGGPETLARLDTQHASGTSIFFVHSGRAHTCKLAPCTQREAGSQCGFAQRAWALQMWWRWCISYASCSNVLRTGTPGHICTHVILKDASAFRAFSTIFDCARNTRRYLVRTDLHISAYSLDEDDEIHQVQMRFSPDRVLSVALCSSGIERMPYVTWLPALWVEVLSLCVYKPVYKFFVNSGNLCQPYTTTDSTAFEMPPLETSILGISVLYRFGHACL